jgi:DNA-binding HxlR family transcriptional regulator
MYERLTELANAGLIDNNAEGNYCLIKLGFALGAALAPLHEWSDRWARQELRRLDKLR